MRVTQGFTLIELLVTVAVLAIVISIAAPSFSNMLSTNRALAITNELQGAIQLARSEAVKRRNNVVICRRNDAGDECANAIDWANGWVILSGATVIKAWGSAGSLAVTGPEQGLTFKPNGAVIATAGFSVNSPGCSGKQKRILTVSSTGSTTVDKVDCT